MMSSRNASMAATQYASKVAAQNASFVAFRLHEAVQKGKRLDKALTAKTPEPTPRPSDWIDLACGATPEFSDACKQCDAICNYRTACKNTYFMGGNAAYRCEKSVRSKNPDCDKYTKLCKESVSR